MCGLSYRVTIAVTTSVFKVQLQLVVFSVNLSYLAPFRPNTSAMQNPT